MNVELLRFTTAGSVDDGKSTLIGRLLYDTKQVFDDQLEHVAQASRRRGGEGTFDLSLLTDGLRAEREQGITIDVAYRYFASDGTASGGSGRRFIIADVPGHKQYTRNMVTGASTADLSIVLLDARQGAVEQSRRHAFISSLLGIPHLVVCVNKMDLVDWSEQRFHEIVADFERFASNLEVSDLRFIPISALHGDNVVSPSTHTSWYDGPTLLAHLETVELSEAHPEGHPARFPVQWVIRPSVGASDAAPAGDSQTDLSAAAGVNGNSPAPASSLDADYRGYAGQLAGGTLRPGDDVLVLPSAQRSRIASIDTFDGSLERAQAPMSVTLRLEDDLDVSRGDLICHPDSPPAVDRELTATLCWMSERPLRAGDRLLLKHSTRTVQAIVAELLDSVDVDTLQRDGNAQQLELNGIGHVRLRTSTPLTFDAYRENRITGSFILIDPAGNETMGAGLLERGH